MVVEGGLRIEFELTRQLLKAGHNVTMLTSGKLVF